MISQRGLILLAAGVSLGKNPNNVHKTHFNKYFAKNKYPLRPVGPTWSKDFPRHGIINSNIVTYHKMVTMRTKIRLSKTRNIKE